MSLQEDYDREVREEDHKMELVEQYYKGAQDCRAAFKLAMKEPGCHTCKNGRWFEDASVGIPLHMEDCKYWPLDNNGEPIEPPYEGDPSLFEKELPKLCGHYEIDPDKVGPQW